eukprot:tig00021038_g17570.t1
MRVLASARLFDRRTTCVQWHPDPARASDVAVVASHGGDIKFWRWRVPGEEPEIVVSGQGKGGSISEMRFHAHDHNVLFTTSIDQTVKRHDIERRSSTFFLDTMNLDHWFVCLDVNLERGLLLAGDNLGWGHLVALDGAPQGKVRLHKKKVQTVGFNPRDANVLVTSSNDYTCCLWDVRKTDRPTRVLPHEACINSAFFSPLSGTKLLTTPQNDELRIYDLSGDLDAPLVVPHPHRHFQHLTKIRAIWHPLDEGTALVGRYDDTRSIDVLEARTGEIRCSLRDAACPTITTCLSVSPDGSLLLAGSGQSAFAWSRLPGAEGPAGSGIPAAAAEFPAAPARGRPAPTSSKAKASGSNPKGKTSKAPAPASTSKKRPRPEPSAGPAAPPPAAIASSSSSSSSSARAAPPPPSASSSAPPRRRPAASDAPARARPPPGGRRGGEREEEGAGGDGEEEGAPPRPSIPFEQFRFTRRGGGSGGGGRR